MMTKNTEDKNEYRKVQADACHSAAGSSSSAEVRRAFLELEQGWLQLMGIAPEETRDLASSDQKVRAVLSKARRRKGK
ncbi:hypothetical protein JQ593_18395 [Bradyrhizobium viridifuturi]|uniref:hypothetical protein n=1 Tax=uncultured Bradyrhizobium sp. TaxID=199684 RepID=UPI001BABEBB0|nr:hypothetical protein [uncultured Bradyrhizobium sp.]MBR1041065.1 hypothetical protein [Bradyrhizobium viridifuturi]MBR1075061.1 hypothetical protein [Bradyrhizobium viridifuturi]